jgi:hypothetical protein
MGSYWRNSSGNRKAMSKNRLFTERISSPSRNEGWLVELMAKLAVPVDAAVGSVAGAPVACALA